MSLFFVSNNLCLNQQQTFKIEGFDDGGGGGGGGGGGQGGGVGWGWGGEGTIPNATLSSPE